MKSATLNKSIRLANRYRATLPKREKLQAAAGKEGSLYIYAAIGDSWWSDNTVTAQKVKDALEGELSGTSKLNIYINSEGGDIYEAKAIHSILGRYNGEKVVHVDGLAASAATFIAMVGDKIITAPHATWMIHEVRTVAYGRAEEFRAMADLLDMENRIFAETYASRSGNNVDDVLSWMNAETWMTASEALERGFTDEVSSVEEDEDEEEQKAASMIQKIAASTNERVRKAQMSAVARLASQSNRLNQLSKSGQPDKAQRPAAGAK